MHIPRLRFLRSGYRRLNGHMGTLGGLSRQGVIASGRWLRTNPLPPRSQRILWLLPASLMIGSGVAMLAAADLGVAPYDVLLSAVARRTPLSFGQAAWLVSGTLLALAAMLGERVNPLGLGFVVLNGFTIDLARELVVAPDSLPTRVGMATVGASVLAGGVAVVVHRAATGGAFEALMLAAERRGHRPDRVRALLEMAILVIGIGAGGAIGPMTVLIAVTIGPAIAASLQALDDHRSGRQARRESTLTESFLQS